MRNKIFLLSNIFGLLLIKEKYYMKLDQNTGAPISLKDAQEFVTNFRKLHPNEITSLFAGSKIIKSILEQEDCVGIRIYNGYNEKEQRLNSVLIGVDSKGEDLLSIIADEMFPCPSTCPKVDILLR